MDAAVLGSIVPALAGLRVVEAGCGTGKNTGWLAERCLWLAALDFSAGMMAVARRKVQAGNVGWARCDLNRPWPLVGESADLVMFNLVLEHVQRLEPVFAQAARVLRVGGAMVLSEFHAVRLAESLMGAQITGEAGEVLEFVGSFRHAAGEYEQAAGAVGLRLVESREWWEEGDERPLLLTMRFEKG
jgi:malonyl-CoA O-methyltransferase